MYIGSRHKRRQIYSIIEMQNVEATFHKNALIFSNFICLLMCRWANIFFFKPILFFDLSCFFLVNITTLYTLLFGYCLSRLLRYDLKVSDRKWLLTSEVIWGWKYWYSRAYTKLPIWFLYTFNLVPFFRFRLQSSWFTSTFDLEGTWGRKYFHSKVMTLNFLSISYRFRDFDFKVLRVWPWTLTFRGQEIKQVPVIRNPMTSYLFYCTFSLSRIVVEIYSDDAEDFGGWPWPPLDALR